MLAVIISGVLFLKSVLGFFFLIYIFYLEISMAQSTTTVKLMRVTISSFWVQSTVLPLVLCITVQSSHNKFKVTQSLLLLLHLCHDSHDNYT